MPIEIRSLGPSDAAAYRAVRLRGLRESPEAFGSTYDEEIASSVDAVAARIAPADAPACRVVLGAFDGDVLVGIAGCYQESKAKVRHRAVVWGMYVAPEARGQRVGRRLLERAIEEARTWPNVERVTITVVQHVKAARELYLSVGFELFGAEPDALRQSGTSVVMEYLSLSLSPTRSNA
jgi:GNAT superfamily N-acetyltransferase